MTRLGWLLAVVALRASGQEAAPGVESPATESAVPADGVTTQTAPAEALPPEVAPPEELAAPAKSSWEKVIEATGYLASRFSWTRARTWGLLPTDDLPQVQELLELNTQVRVKVRERSYLYTDLSLIGNFAGHYRAKNSDGVEVLLDDHNSPQAQPSFSINELYVFHEFVPELNVLVGKKRVVWGPAMAYNPTDLLNPRRDPTDPSFQRAGVWLAQLEVPLEQMTFSLVFAPTVLKQVSSIPTAMMAWPSWDKQDDLLHYQLMARWYALVADADINVIGYYGNSSVDAFKDKFRFGLTFARYFFTDYELHFELLVQSGSARDVITSECVASQVAALGCVAKGTAALNKPLLDDKSIYPRLLVGTKRQFSDDSLLSLEYLYQSDGWTKAQFQDYASALGLLDAGRKAGLPVNRIPGASALLGGTGSDGLPTRFAFEPRGQHYLFLTFQKPRIFDDFTASVVVLASLTDLSTTWTPSIAWSATEWLTLTLYGFIPVPGPDSLAVKTADGVTVTEFGTTPFAGRVMFEARAFF